jgi:sporulation protein YlmC with PRC-barrel domain
MMRTALLAAFTILAAPAFAQTAWVEVDDRTMVQPFNADADRVEDMDVFDATGRKIGEVEEVIGQSRDAATALVVDFDDDAGYGDRDDVIIPLDRFSLNGVNIVLNADAGAVAAFDRYND